MEVESYLSCSHPSVYLAAGRFALHIETSGAGRNRSRDGGNDRCLLMLVTVSLARYGFD